MNNVYATAAPAKNATKAVKVGTFGFDATIPANATITGVTVTVEWKVSTTASIATLGAQAWVSGTAYGTELVNSAEPTADTTQSFSVTGLTRAQLANGVFEVRVRASRGNTNTAVTASLDVASVKVDYTTPTTISVTTDAAGNLTARGSSSYAYDQANRLTTATVAGATETYAYDGDGVRFSRRVGTGPLIRYVTDPTASLPVTIDDGTRKYVWGNGLAYAVAGTTLEVYHTDRLGSVRAITDATGAVTATYRTDEFGLPTATTGTTSQPYRFTGEPSDATGLTYLRARYYDPSLGRFLSRDSWPGRGDSPASLNRYVYVGNNPVTGTDPSGQCPWCVGAAVGAAIGGVAGLGGYLVGSIATGQAPDLGQAALATAGGATTGGICGATLGVACLATGAATSVIQYQASPGATNPVDDPMPYAFNIVAGASLGRVTGGQVLRRAPVWWGADLVPSVIDRAMLNYPGWARALGASFSKSLLASSGQSILGRLLNPPTAAASSAIKRQR